jgi:hypothetical protein
MRSHDTRVRLFPGSVGRWPAIVGSLSTILSATNTSLPDVIHGVLGWQPALSNPKNAVEYMSI